MKSLSKVSDEEAFREAYDGIYPLLNIDLKLLDINKSKQAYDKSQIGYLIVLKHDLPVFTHEFSPRVSINPDLISNFIVALTIFADDILTTGGQLKTISHDLGTIFIHHENEEIAFIISADIESAIIIYKLRKFASETIEFFDGIDKFRKVNSNNNFLLEKIQDIFIH